MAKNDPQKNQTDGTGNPELQALEREALSAGAAAKEEEASQANPEPEAPGMKLEPEVYKMFWETIFSVIAGRAGDHWQLKESEAKQLATLTGPVAEKWLPSFMNKYGAEMVLASSIIFVIIPRIGKGNEKDGRDNSDTRQAGIGQVNFGASGFKERNI